MMLTDQNLVISCPIKSESNLSLVINHEKLPENRPLSVSLQASLFSVLPQLAKQLANLISSIFALIYVRNILHSNQTNVT